jgi:hypothetical protein
VSADGKSDRLLGRLKNLRRPQRIEWSQLPGRLKNLQRAERIEGWLVCGLLLLAFVNQSKSRFDIVAIIALGLSGFAYFLVEQAKRQWLKQKSPNPDLRPSALAVGVATLAVLTGAALYVFSK